MMRVNCNDYEVLEPQISEWPPDFVSCLESKRSKSLLDHRACYLHMS